MTPYRGRSFFVFHPGFGYFADAYGLHEEAIEAGGRPPTPQRLRTLIEKAKAEGVTTVFIQPQYAPESAQAIADAIGGKVVVLNGLRRDVIADIEDIALKIEIAMRRSTPRAEDRGGKGEGRREEGRMDEETPRLLSPLSPHPSPLCSWGVCLAGVTIRAE